MTLPANIRVNMSVPFPALVQGAAPISITKVNGIWTVGFNVAALGSQSPAPANFPTDYVVVYDSIVNTTFKMPLSVVLSRGQRSITAGPVLLIAGDQILNLNLSTSLTITLPGYLTRQGLPLTFKDVGKQAANFPITIAAAAGEFIDGNASVLLNTAGQSITIVPANDGVNTGWFEE